MDLMQRELVKLAAASSIVHEILYAGETTKTARISKEAVSRGLYLSALLKRLQAGPRQVGDWVRHATNITHLAPQALPGSALEGISPSVGQTISTLLSAPSVSRIRATFTPGNITEQVQAALRTNAQRLAGGQTAARLEHLFKAREYDPALGRVRSTIDPDLRTVLNRIVSGR